MLSTSLIPRREALIESKAKALHLTEIQVRQLRSLGLKLAGRSTYWGTSPKEDSEVSVIEINHTQDLEVYSVSVRNAIGTIALDNLVIDVAPKIPLRHFLFIADASKFLGRFAKSSAHFSGNETFSEVFANHFVDLVMLMTRESQYLDYKRIKSKLSSPRGRILPIKTALSIRSGDVSIFCEADEFSADNTLNRIIVKALQIICSDNTFSKSLRKNGSSLLNEFDVAEIQPADLQNSQRDIPARYLDIANLAKAIILNSYALGAGMQQHGFSFLLPTPSIIESGLRNLIRTGFGDEWVVSPTAARKILAPSKVSVNPDLLLSKKTPDQIEIQLVTGDVKYQIGDANWRRTNLYQASTFATAFRASKGFVIAFKEQDSGSVDSLKVGDVELNLFSWQFADEDDPSKALETLLHEMKNWLAES